MSHHVVLVIAVAILINSGFPAQAEAQAKGSEPTFPDLLQVLKEEVLDTVSFDTPVFFRTPEGRDAKAEPGTYRLKPDKGSTLRLIPSNGKGTLLVRAQPTKHEDAIAEPMALSVPDPENTLHVVLLLPGGRGLDAIGSYSAPRSRASKLAVLSPSRLHQALLGKITSLAQSRRSPEGPARLPGNAHEREGK